MIMCATILEVQRDRLLVRDNSTSQIVSVNTRFACNFRVNNRVKIFYNGIMTMSIPPQKTLLGYSEFRLICAYEIKRGR